MNLKRVLFFLSAVLLTFWGVQSKADTYPSRPIRLIVPFSAGSATDILGRFVAEALGKRLGQTVVVETKPGAGTAIGAQTVAHSAHDGYTLLLGSNATFAVNPAIYKQLPYDPVNDFRILSSAGVMPSFLLVSSKSRFKTLADFVSYAAKHPGELTFASSGVGSTGHLVGEMLAYEAKIKLLHVPFKNGPQGLNAVVSGDVDSIFYTSTAAMPMITAKRVIPLAVSTATRTNDLPDVPTIAESGYKGFDFAGWLAVAVAKNTPQPIVDKLSKALDDMRNDPAFKEQLEKIGILLPAMSHPAFLAFVAKDIKRMKELAATAHIQAR